MGILLAAELADAYRMQVLGETVSEPLANRFDEDFLSCSLPIGCPFRVSAMAEIMRKDKKAAGSMVHFILPFAVGDVRDIELTVEQVCDLLR
jgi:3-dehydroquinate synthetase